MGTFAQQFKEVLGTRNLTQMEAAKLLGISQSMVSAYLRGGRVPPERTILLIENRLGVKFDRRSMAAAYRIRTDGNISDEDAQVLREEGRNYMERVDIPMLDLMRSLRRRYHARAGDRRQIELALEMVFGDDFKVLKKWLEAG